MSFSTHEILSLSTAPKIRKKKTLQISGEVTVAPVNLTGGCAIAQAVSHSLLTAAARVRAQVRQCGIFGRQTITRSGFLRVLRFPLPILISFTAQHWSSTICSWYDRPISGRHSKWTHLTPPQETKKPQTGSLHKKGPLRPI
jgi:hypothetical protein